MGSPKVSGPSRTYKNGRAAYVKNCACCKAEFVTVNKNTVTCCRECATRNNWTGEVGKTTPDGMSCAYCGLSLGGFKHIQLHRKDGSVSACTVVDSDMFADLARDYWHKSINGYAVRCFYRDGTRCYDYVHRRVLGINSASPLFPDHINRDRLDNRRLNLRLVTGSENEQNRDDNHNATGYRNVGYRKESQTYFATICVGGKVHTLGHGQATAKEAAVYARILRERYHTHAPKETITNE